MALSAQLNALLICLVVLVHHNNCFISQKSIPRIQELKNSGLFSNFLSHERDHLHLVSAPFSAMSSKTGLCDHGVEQMSTWGRKGHVVETRLLHVSNQTGHHAKRKW